MRNLAQRGFPNVHNKNEDFYACAAAGRTPEYDVLVTNPPYSEDHIERIVRFCVEKQKPWFLLVPNYVYVNPYFDEIMQKAAVKCGRLRTLFPTRDAGRSPAKPRAARRRSSRRARALRGVAPSARGLGLLEMC